MQDVERGPDRKGYRCGEFYGPKVDPVEAAGSEEDPANRSYQGRIPHCQDRLVRGANDLRYGIASACIGGGQGIALLIENPDARKN